MIIKTKTIKQGVIFPAAPEKIYKILLDSKLHSQFTGDAAKMSKKAGGKFSAFSGYITGTNLVLVPGKKIRQAWTTTEWPKGHMSEVTYLLKKTKNGARLMFTHKGVPAWDYKDKASGWKKFYWQPLKNFLGNKKF